MRKLLFTIATAATVFAAGMLAAPRAEAMAMPAPSGLAQAVVDLSGIEDVRYVCRRYYGRYGTRTRCYYVRGYYRRSYRRGYY